jgi:hypothetical protein
MRGNVDRPLYAGAGVKFTPPPMCARTIIKDASFRRSLISSIRCHVGVICILIDVDDVFSFCVFIAYLFLSISIRNDSQYLESTAFVPKTCGSIM